MAFCIKWYRARYVFKIPVWDRQPNWNNVITDKSQEKTLRALTCKNCGTTLFIAKTREFFFEGNTGLGGLGCFHCGKKGKDNFIMDRDRIVEDVGEMDDYFDYERPLDFVSRAERRKLLQEAAGDEAKANQMLIDKASGGGATANGATAAAPSLDFIDAEINGNDAVAETNGSEAPKKKKKKKKKKIVEEEATATTTLEELTSPEEPATPLANTSTNNDDNELSAIKKKKKKVAAMTPPAALAYSNSVNDDNDDLSALDMDGW
jgi:hypothetical protein